MAKVIIKIKIMPESPDANLEEIKKGCREKMEGAGGYVHSVVEEPVAFGLKAIIFIFMIDEKDANMDRAEASLKSVPGVSSVDVLDVRRAVG